MSQLKLELVNVPGLATYPTIEQRGEPSPCPEFNTNTMSACTGQRVQFIVTTSPSLVGFAKTECPVCGVVRVL